jgi:hypothetical protein
MHRNSHIMYAFPQLFILLMIIFIYLLTAIGWTPGDTYTHKKYTEQHNDTEYTEYYITIRIHKQSNKNT